MTPPNVDGAPKPTSSVMISSTLGAPFGGTVRGGHHGFDWEALRVISPPDFGGGGGRKRPSMVVVAAGEPDGGPLGGARRWAATKVPARTPAIRTSATWAA